MGDVKLSLDPALIAYVEDRVKSLFGYDAETNDWNDRLARRMLLAAEQARFVKCVGMDRPIPIDDIYQPIGLKTAAGERYQRALQTDIWRLIQFRDKQTNENRTRWDYIRRSGAREEHVTKLALYPPPHQSRICTLSFLAAN